MPRSSAILTTRAPLPPRCARGGRLWGLLVTALLASCGSNDASTPSEEPSTPAPTEPPAASSPLDQGDGTVWAWRDDAADAACSMLANTTTTPSCDWPRSWPGPAHPTRGFAGVQRENQQHRPVRLLPGEPPTPIGPTAELVRSVRWSPSGALVTWEAHEAGISTVMVGDGTPTGASPLHPHRAGSFEPDIRDDGTVVFASSRDGNAELYLATPELKRITTHPGDDQRPRFSPDGSRLAWLASRDGNTRLVRAMSDGSQSVPVSPSHLEALDFAWSPDSTYIAVVVRTPGEPAFAMVHSAANGSTRSVLKPDGHVTGLAWSPSSRELILSASTEHGSALHTARVSGRDLRRLALPETPAAAHADHEHHPSGPWLPRWSR